MDADAGTWLRIADGVLVRRYAELDQTLGLVTGTRACLVVDTGRDEHHGYEFAAAVREVTGLPWQVVITHAHFDHFLGTAAFAPCPVWAHARCPGAIAATDRPQRERWAAHYRDQGRPAAAAALEAAATVLPSRLLTGATELDLGQRTVTLIHPGRGHTDHDVIVHVPDTGVVFAGDLVEQGAPPSVGEDSWPDEWPAALETILALGPAVVVPGHGDPVDRAFVERQRAWVVREASGA
ncbi:MBL fold metallo-hydrolase [Haloechinothrix sp. LS1_15]|uniref:MBL fold metallo-hydrolase n=1 Tax=Haloechinothrix sp. LS1_15 TaxID=2652248 RepID=UPI00294B94DA|nr:MBL fold metallo-hydrolase [Haloechinothrix sp. LS1_15]